MRNDDQEKPDFEEGSGNVFADLGLGDAEELFARSKIGFYVHRILKAKKLPQKEIATLLGIKPPEVSHLMNGHFSRFSTDKLLDFLKRLDRKVTIRISPHRPGEPYQEVEQFVGGEAAEMAVHHVRHFRLLDPEQRSDFPLREILVL